MNVTRREVLLNGGLVGMLSVVAGCSNDKHAVKVCDASAIVLLELLDSADIDDDRLARVQKRAQELFGSTKVVVLPPGTKATIVNLNAAAYQREKLGEYEYEVHAKDEAALVERLVKYFNNAGVLE